MDIQFFDDPSLVPRPREEIRVEEVEIAVYPDRFRVFLHVRVTPFLERPNLLVTIRRSDGKLVSELNIIETMHYDMEFTLHIRGVEDPAGDYEMAIEVFYESRNPPQFRHVEHFSVPSASHAEGMA